MKVNTHDFINAGNGWLKNNANFSLYFGGVMKSKPNRFIAWSVCPRAHAYYESHAAYTRVFRWPCLQHVAFHIKKSQLLHRHTHTEVLNTAKEMKSGYEIIHTGENYRLLSPRFMFPLALTLISKYRGHFWVTWWWNLWSRRAFRPNVI